MIVLALKILGIICVLKAIYAIYLLIRVYTVKLDKKWASRFGKDPWAIVTGCTGGIGK